MAETLALTGGFHDPAPDAAQAFRIAMDVMARPGTIQDVAGGQGPSPLSPAAATLLLTLCDSSTPVFLADSHNTAEIRQWLSFHTGAPITGRRGAQFALGTWGDLAPLEGFPLGSPEFPDRSVTLIIEMDQLDASGVTLKGPGIKDTAQLNLPDPEAHRINRSRFPLGFDCFFAAGSQLAALPRSTEVL